MLSLITTALILLLPSPAPLANAADELFSVKEYGAFHEALHPLEHEALPSKDFKRIGANAKELVKRGKAIVKLDVPPRTAEKYNAEFRKELKKFSESLKLFDQHARKGSDRQLEESFSAVHDSFE